MTCPVVAAPSLLPQPYKTPKNQSDKQQLSAGRLSQATRLPSRNLTLGPKGRGARNEKNSARRSPAKVQ